MSELLEIIMIVSFGISWPMNVVKSIKARTTKGKSLAFLLLIASLPSLIACYIFASGIALILPILLVGGAFGMLKCCL